MIRIYSRLAIPLLAIFIALSIAARALGSTQPPNPALRGFTEGCEGKPQPCWYGIVEGIATEEAERILTHLGYKLDGLGISEGAFHTIIASSELDCSIRLVTSLRTNSVAQMRIHGGDCFTFGDLILAWGNPTGLIARAVKWNEVPSIIYDRGYLFSPWPVTSSILSPYTQFQETLPYQSEPIETRIIQWRGFMPNWRYCRIEFPSSACVLFRNQTTLPLPTSPSLNTPLPYSVSPTQTPYP